MWDVCVAVLLDDVVGINDGIDDSPGDLLQSRCAPQLPHQFQIKEQVMNGVETRAQNLVDALQMVQIGAGEMAAGIAAACLVEWREIVPVTRIAQFDDAAPGEQPAIAGITRGQHAIEEINAGGNGVDDILRRSDPHQVAWPVGGQLRRGVPENAQHVGFGFTHRQPADRITVETDLPQSLKRFVAQRLVHSSLHDAKERVRIAGMRTLGAPGPAQREFHRGARLGHARGVRRALVEHHDDVRVEDALDAHGLLGREEQRITVHRRLEPHALLADLSQRAETEDLESPGIGEYWPLPTHEAVEPAVRLDHLQAGTQPQVKGIAEHDVRAELDELCRTHCFHRPIRAHGHEGRCLDAAVGGGHDPAARGAVGGEKFKLHSNPVIRDS